MKLTMKYRKLIAIPFITMIVGYILLVLINLIPTKLILTKAKESANILSSEGLYPGVFFSFMDNWTNADCISIIVNKKTNNPFYNAINAYEYANEADTQGIERLQSSLAGRAYEVHDHSYLWHGFQLWLKPLLLRYNITEIRLLMYFIIIALVSILCVLLAQTKNNPLGFLPFLAAFTIFNFQLNSLSLLFFNDFSIALIASIIALHYKNKALLQKVWVEPKIILRHDGIFFKGKFAADEVNHGLEKLRVPESPCPAFYVLNDAVHSLKNGIRVVTVKVVQDFSEMIFD